MTLQEANKQFHIKMETLEFYEKNNFIKGKKKEEGHIDYQEEEIQRAVQIHSLLKAGMNLDVLKRFVSLMETGTNTSAEQIKMLRKCRYQLLEEIHKRQESLDRLDYFIQKIKYQDRKDE